MMFILTFLLCMGMFMRDVMLDYPSCGTVNITISCHRSAMVQLTQSDTMKTCMKPRWWFYNASILAPKGPEQLLPNTKYDISNRTLTIHNLNQLDEGKYSIDCYDGKVSCSAYSEPLSTAVNKSKCDITSTLSTVASTSMTNISGVKQTNDLDVKSSNTMIAVIAVCAAVIIVVGVSGTLLIVVRKRATQIEDTRHLANNENGSNVNLQERNESTIYHEVGNALENEKIDNCDFNSSKLSLLSVHSSPALPKRPDNKRFLTQNENEYALIRDSVNKDIGKKNKAKVATNRTKNGMQIAINVPPCDESYAEKASKEESVKDVNDCSLMNNNNLPEYSKVLKRQVSADIEKQPDIPKGNNNNHTEHSVVFQQINCSELVRKLSIDLQENDTSTLEDSVTYCNIESKRRRSKARGSIIELQYAVLDHTGSVAHLDAQSYRVYDLPNFGTCQYASIDFDKKAFVAPVRKAPSTWHRRRNSQANKS